MAASFASASSQGLTNAAPPVLNYPFTVGVWVYPTTTAVTKSVFSLCDTATTNNYFGIRQASGDNWGIYARAGGTENSTSTGAVTGNAWHFLAGRFIAATNRALAVLAPNGVMTSNASATSRAPAGADTMTIGSLETSAPGEFFDGSIGEFWITNSDIQADAATLQLPMLRQLAYGGPFSVPHIAKDIIEYRSFRKYPSSEGDDPTEVFHGAFGRQTWANTNGVTTGPHPPLPYWYVKPGQTIQNLTI